MISNCVSLPLWFSWASWPQGHPKWQDFGHHQHVPSVCSVANEKAFINHTFLQLKSAETYRREYCALVAVTRPLQVAFASELPIPPETLAPVIKHPRCETSCKTGSKISHQSPQMLQNSLILLCPRLVSYHYYLSPSKSRSLNPSWPHNWPLLS